MSWSYTTAVDPCPICEAHWEKGPYTDEQIKKLFPNAEDILPGIIRHPRVHPNCRCGLVRLDRLEAVGAKIQENKPPTAEEVLKQITTQTPEKATENLIDWFTVWCIAYHALKPKKKDQDSPNFVLGKATGWSFATSAELPHPMTGRVVQGDGRGFYIQGGDGKIHPGPGYQTRKFATDDEEECEAC